MGKTLAILVLVGAAVAGLVWYLHRRGTTIFGGAAAVTPASTPTSGGTPMVSLPPAGAGSGLSLEGVNSQLQEAGKASGTLFTKAAPPAMAMPTKPANPAVVLPPAGTTTIKTLFGTVTAPAAISPMMVKAAAMPPPAIAKPVFAPAVSTPTSSVSMFSTLKTVSPMSSVTTAKVVPSSLPLVKIGFGR